MSSAGRLRCDPPCPADLEDIHRIYSDARTWAHFPGGRFTTREQTMSFLDRLLQEWNENDLASWVVREGDRVVGHGGCTMHDERFWNLGYRFAPEAQGRGPTLEDLAAVLGHRP